MNRLHHLRKNVSKITLNELAEKTQIGRSSLNKIELGNQNMLLDQAITLADFFNVSIDYLAGREFNTPEKTVVKVRDFDFDDVRVKLNEFDNKQLYRLLGTIENIIDLRSETQFDNSYDKISKNI